MSEGKKRKVHTAEFKAKVGMEAVRGVKTISEIAQAYGVHPQLVGQWKKEILESAGTLFESKRGPKPVEGKSGEDRLYGEIGRLKMENDWLKKVEGVSIEARMEWIDGADALPLSRQCELAEVPRATVYRRLTAKIPQDAGAEGLLLCRLIDEEYTPVVLRQPAHGGVPARSGPRHQPQARAAVDTQHGVGGHGAGAEHEPSASTTRSTPTCCGACR
jgi:transposase-like protein